MRMLCIFFPDDGRGKFVLRILWDRMNSHGADWFVHLVIALGHHMYGTIAQSKAMMYLPEIRVENTLNMPPLAAKELKKVAYDMGMQFITAVIDRYKNERPQGILNQFELAMKREILGFVDQSVGPRIEGLFLLRELKSLPNLTWCRPLF